jgi:hypothetical protein
MSLSTQLHRGTLALPMLLLFAALALVANEDVGAKPQSEATPAVFAHATATASIEASACTHAGLMLGNAPADLAPLAQHAGACRA